MSLSKRVSALVALPLAVVAFPSFRDRIPNGRRVKCPDGVAGCETATKIDCDSGSICHGVGHANCVGGSMPLNVFGKALQKAVSWTEALCMADADGDGLTNGEELGDPCCLWRAGDEPSDYTKTFTATHPGFPQPAAEVSAYRRPNCTITPPKTKGTIFNRFNDGEVQKSVSYAIEGFEIPAMRTTYKWFAWNFDDETADVFHAVSAEALIDKVKYLHHYVVRGCSQKVKAETQGMPMDKDPPGCSKQFGSWAPGASVLSMPQWAGLQIGKKGGAVAFAVQVHYDNKHNDPGVIDSSGIRIWYTPTLRKIVTGLLNVNTLSTNGLIAVPPGVARWFLTRTCKLSVTDATTGAPAGPLNLIGITYHAHLLGREMYAEFLKKGSDEWQDLGSEKKWHFDDQALRDLTLRNITFNDGDIIQTTCVMDSRSESNKTTMGLETTNEMCWASMQVWPAGYKMICSGPMWSGELGPTESAEMVGVRQPPEEAPMVLDGTNLMSGGAVLKLDGKIVAPMCIDMVNNCNLLGKLWANQTSKCDEKMGDAFVAVADNTLLQVCCLTACQSICQQHTWCWNRTVADQKIDSGISVQKKMKPWCTGPPAAPGPAAILPTEASHAEGLARGRFAKQLAIFSAAWAVLAASF